MSRNGVVLLGVTDKTQAVIDAARECHRAYIDFHQKFMSHREIFGKDMTEKSDVVERANIEMVTAQFMLGDALAALDKAQGAFNA